MQALSHILNAPSSGAPALAGSPELVRVLSIPRRADVTEDEVEAWSAMFRQPGSTATLRPLQVAALRELWHASGLVAPMPVGSGKTIPTLLAPTLLGSQRPVLLVPANLRAKTRRDYATYHADWRVRLPTIVSYQELGRPDREHKLLELVPDLLILDEAHAARNEDAACTRRIKRAIELLCPRVLMLSGTLITPHLLDFWHFLVWALGAQAPVPLQRAEAERWATAVDRDVPEMLRSSAGALEQIPGGLMEWIRNSAGVVPGTTEPDCSASINLSFWKPKLPDELQATIDAVARSGMRPDGELLDELELPDCLCQLAQGFYYVWNPMPPPEWLRPRRCWFAYVRAVLDEHLEGFDSPSQIVNALDRGHGLLPPAPGEGRALLAAWRDVRDTFVPNPVAVWLSADPLAQAADRARRSPNAIVWTRHRAAGQILDALGVPYYGGGQDPETHPKPGSAIACSIAAHGTGKNLQAWSRMLVLTPPARAEPWEQLIGREHRQGQTADTVGVEVIDAIAYHRETMRRVKSEAKATARASGFPQKLTLADWR